jgi:hypothetical protein
MSATIDPDESDTGYMTINSHGANGPFLLPSGTLSITPVASNYTMHNTFASNITMSTSIMSIQAQDGGDAIIKTNRNKINLDEVADTLQVIKERLLILTPDFELMEQYPTLKDAYDQYKVLEAMLKEEKLNR